LPHEKFVDNWRRVWRTAVRGIPYLTLPKLFNVLRCETEKWRRVVRPKALPYVAVIDVANRCNLRCPYCPTGARRPSGRDKKLIEPLLVKQLLDELDRYLISVNLYNWGEPLLHPQIAQMVKMIHERRIFTKISSNLSIAKPELVTEVCRAGLDYLTVSVAGASQEVYERYHRGGTLQTVLENIKHVTAYKKKFNSKFPVIEFKYLLFKQNRHELETARALAYGLGADIFKCHTGGGPEEATIATPITSDQPHAPKFCHHLWNMIVVNSDGGIAPCCFLFFKRDDLGEYSLEPVRLMRNNQQFLRARQLFNPAEVSNLPANLSHPCLKCEIVHEQPHLKAYLPMNPHAKQDHRTGGA
jgi:organic radical activating enzyme